MGSDVRNRLGNRLCYDITHIFPVRGEEASLTISLIKLLVYDLLN